VVEEQKKAKKLVPHFSVSTIFWFHNFLVPKKKGQNVDFYVFFVRTERVVEEQKKAQK